MNNTAPIGIFDSGYGGLTVLQSIREWLPKYDYIYLGDNARVPYGGRSFDTVYQYTRQCVFALWEMGCPLVIVACNTASAKALRNIQQLDLPTRYPDKKVLGVIRPTTERIGMMTQTGHVGIFATQGTVSSLSYTIELQKYWPDIQVHQVACPMWVPLIENDEYDSPGGVYFVQKYCDTLMSINANIDTIILGCTHYPILIDLLKAYLPDHINIVSQGPIVADRLADYLSRHSDIEADLSKGGVVQYFTTDDPALFDAKSKIFVNDSISSVKMIL